MSDIPLSLYVHFPWCVKKCPYCDFNSHALRADLPERAYVDALIQDLHHQLARQSDRTIQTVFLGGGTPSLISPAQIQRLMDALISSGRLAKRAEVTLEANPGTLDETFFEDYLRAGINRLSIGVQSFENDALQKIGRIHSAEQAKSAVIRARQAGFKCINLDLMYGLPGQSVKDSRRDIETALSQEVSHLSVYQLTIEPNTEFAVRTPRLPDSEQYWDMQEQAQSLLQAAGFEQYEVSAYSQNAECQHNLNYWQFGDYLAIGAGAHGKLSETDGNGVFNIWRYWNHRHPKAYLQAAQTGEFVAQNKAVEKSERDLEFLMNALRLRAGFDISTYTARTHCEPQALVEKLTPFFNKEWLQQRQGAIRPTDAGFQFLDSILMEMV